MRTRFAVLCAAMVLCVLFSGELGAGTKVRASMPFTATVLADGLENPWEMVLGPDNFIWVTERTGKKVTRVNPENGAKKVVLTIQEAITGNQQGVLGLALSPDFQDTGHVYLVYTFAKDGKPQARIMRYTYDSKLEILGNPYMVLDNLPAGDDHNAGRLIFGLEGYLYYSHGEQGHNQGSNYCKPIEAQCLPTESQIENKDWSTYKGKILRLGIDGSIPGDNPVLEGVRSHIFTYGHRNPQGLVRVGERIFSVEHGPSTDDEINLLVSGGNYGWPHVAGYRDNQAYVYANWSEAKNCSELAFDANIIPEGVPFHTESFWEEDFIEPLKTLHTVPNGYNFTDGRCASMPYLCWPTVAPSSIAYYPKNGPIPGWSNSLVISTLKSGALYRFKLSQDGKFLQGDEEKLFRTANRYRAVLIHPDGKTLFVATDSEGNALDDWGNPTQTMQNPGAILVFTYTGK